MNRQFRIYRNKNRRGYIGSVWGDDAQLREGDSACSISKDGHQIAIIRHMEVWDAKTNIRIVKKHAGHRLAGGEIT